MRLVDTHCHLYSDKFGSDRLLAVERALDAGVDTILLPNVDETTIGPMLDLVAQNPSVCKPMIGLHPTDVRDNYADVLNHMEEMLFAHPEKYFGIGETGLDLYWDKTGLDKQVISLNRHCHWAKNTKKPLSLHTRDAFEQTYQIIKSNQDGNLSGVFHCFTGSVNEAKRVIDMGFYLGIGGVATFKNSGVIEVLKAVGLDYIVFETDAPYLAPTPHRGKRNEPAYIKIIAEYVANAFDLPISEVAAISTRNALKVFPI